MMMPEAKIIVDSILKHYRRDMPLMTKKAWIRALAPYSLRSAEDAYDVLTGRNDFLFKMDEFTSMCGRFDQRKEQENAPPEDEQPEWLWEFNRRVIGLVPLFATGKITREEFLSRARAAAKEANCEDKVNIDDWEKRMEVDHEQG